MQDESPTLRRDLDFFPVEHEGRQLILIRDPLGLVQEGKAIEASLFRFMALVDGTRDLRDLQEAWMRQQGGIFVRTDELERLFSGLDASYLLDSERFKKAREEIVTGFQARPVRPAAFCGRSYPDHPAELIRSLDEILSSAIPCPMPEEGTVKALVAPHIDLSVGFRAYASAYRMLKYTAPSRVVVLGVGHQMCESLYSLTDKDFETPLGTVPCDKPAVERLRKAGQGVVGGDDFAHRSEHSIEFQLIFLRHLLGDGPCQIVPILCGSVRPVLGECSRRAYLDKAGSFLEALAAVLAEPGRRTLLVAGVDLSHIGPKFGHPMPARSLEGQAEAHDRRLLDRLMQRRPDDFWAESLEVEDRFNVCGFSALACLLEVLGPGAGKLLRYEMWHEEATRSAVSYAALAFTSP